MTCKVAIGSRYEPKYFERRDPINYSAKNPYMDRDSAAMQQVLLGTSRRRFLSRKLWWAVVVMLITTLYLVSLT